MKNPNLFNTVPVTKVKNTAFDLSHEVKSSGKLGQLMPFLCTEVLPGDVFKINVEHLVRFAPMLAPIMHRVDVYTHFFFVPNRLIWNEWEDFITGGKDGTLTPVPPVAVIPSNVSFNGSLSDFLGVPPCPEEASGPVSQEVSILPFRAYWEIYNNYYVDQNVGNPVEFSKSGGKFTFDRNTNTLRVRCWEKDYFTSALPFPQRSTSPVTLPIGEQADVYLNTMPNGKVEVQGVVNKNEENVSGQLQSSGALMINSQNVYIDPNGTYKTDLSTASGVNINELRRAFSLQRWLETSARVGYRYIEQILGHFGVRSSDARLQRPEYLGGGKTPVVISQVEQTSAAQSGGTPLGQLGGQGTSYGSSHKFKRRFEEHGFVLGIMSVVPKPCYQDGLSRMFTRNSRWDYYWPEFAHLGEQEIQEREIFLDWESKTDGSLNTQTFGYTPRYAEYRYMPSSVHGDFRDSLDFWHMGRKFANAPGLNGQFLSIYADGSDDGAPDRVFAVQGVDHLWIQSYVNFKALRKMPKYGKPGL